MSRALAFFLLLLALSVLVYVSTPDTPAQFTSPAAGGGTSDSIGVDTDADGVIDNYLYSTAGPIAMIKKGANITLTVETDTLTIAGPAASGTADSIAVDTTGDGAVDAYLYSSAGAIAMLRQGDNMTFSVNIDTLYLNVNSDPWDSLTAWGNLVNDNRDSATTHSPLVNEAKDSLTAWANLVNSNRDSATTHSPLVNEAKDSLTAWGNLINDNRDSATTHSPLVNESKDSLTSWGDLVNDNRDSVTTHSPLVNEAKDSLTSWANKLNTAYDWGDHSTQNYLDDDVGQDVDGDDVDSTDEDFVFDDAYRRTSQYDDSMFMTKAYIDAAAGGLTPQSVKGDHVDSTAEDFVFDDAFRTTSAEPESMFMTKAYIDAAAGGLTPQSVKGDHVDSTSEDFVFNDAYRITSEQTDSMLMSKAYIDGSDDTLTHETVEDVAGDMATGNTEWGITVIYQDGDGTIDYEVDSTTLYGAIHDSLFANAPNYLDKDVDDTDDLTQGSTNLYDQPLTDSANWSTAYSWGDHSAEISETLWAHLDDTSAVLWTGLTDTTWDMKNGFVWSGAHEFTGGTPSLEIPNADAPSTDAEGEIAWDANDDAIEVFSGDESESVLLPMYYDIEAMVFAPDGVNDYIPIFHVDALLYPHGIEIDQLSITLPTSTDYTLPVHEVGSDHAFDARIDSLVVSSAQYLEDGSPMDGNLDADDYIYLNVPSTDVDWIFVKIIYHVTEGN